MPRPGDHFTVPPEALAKTRQLSAFDAQFLAGEVGNIHSHYCGVGVFDPHPTRGPLTVEQVRQVVADRIGRIPLLRWRLKTVPFGLDHPVFVDGPVDIDRHVIASTVAPPGGDRELAATAELIMATPLDRSRPLWEFHVIEGLAGGRTAVGLKFHHAGADALAASTVAGLLLDTHPEGDERLPPRSEPPRVPGSLGLFARGAVRVASHPRRAARAAARSLPYLDQVPMMRTLPGARTLSGSARRAKHAVGSSAVDPGAFAKAPRMRFNGSLSSGRRCAFGAVDLAVVKRLKAEHKVSFNDVVVAGIAGGLRRRLQAGDELPDAPLLAFVPANVRTSDQRGDFGNAISSFVVTVPTNEPDPAQRIRSAHTALSAAKARHAVAPSSLVTDANELIPAPIFGLAAGGLLRLLGSGLIDPPLNLIISNVPGPPQQVYLAGAPMRALWPFSLVFDGVGLNVTVVSFGDELQVGVVGDRTMAPDVWELIGDIQAEFAELANF